MATTEIRFGDNDRLAALVAHLVHADLLLLLSDVDGLYDGEPTDAGAALLAEVRGDADLAGVRIGTAGAAGVGTGGMQTKVEAARIATGAGIPVVLDLRRPRRRGARRRAGRHVVPPHRPAPPHPAAVARARDRGQGAARPRRRGGAGGAASGGPRCCRPGSPASRARSSPATRSTSWPPTGAPVARGLVNYDSDELPGAGRAARRASSRGSSAASYEREVVHRDDLVLLRSADDRPPSVGSTTLHRRRVDPVPADVARGPQPARLSVSRDTTTAR